MNEEQNLSENTAPESMDDYKDAIEHSFHKVHPGDLLTGTVIGTSEAEVTVDFGSYTEGIIPLEELSHDPKFSIRADIAPGDTVTAKVLRPDNGLGQILLSKKQADDVLVWDVLKEAMASGKVYTVTIIEAVKSGVIAYVEGMRGFIPASQLSLNYVEDLDDWVNRTIDVVVLDVKEETKGLVLSAKVLERKKAEEERTQKLDTLKRGMLTTGVVEKLAPYGAFIRLGDGLTGLLHISQICDYHIKSPKEKLSVGEEVTVKIINIGDGKISLSMKAAAEEEEEARQAAAPTEYKDEGQASTGLGALLAGIKLED